MSLQAMAGNHPIHVHPARPLYRFTATALGASMWFFVSLHLSLPFPFLSAYANILSTGAVNVSCEEGRTRFAWLEASMGSLSHELQKSAF